MMNFSVDFFPDAADYKLRLVSLNTASVTVNSQHCLHGSRKKAATRYSFRNVLTNPDVNCKNFAGISVSNLFRLVHSTALLREKPIGFIVVIVCIE